MMGRARMPSHSLTTGVDNSSSSCCWREMSSSRAVIKASVVTSASPSRSSVVVQTASKSLSWLLENSARNAEKIGLFSFPLLISDRGLIELSILARIASIVVRQHRI